MGQRGAIIMFLNSGGILLPVLVAFGIASSVGRAAFPIALLLELAGIACLVVAKLPQMAAGHMFAFGSKRLSAGGRRFYWSGYALVGFGLLLAVASLPFAHI